MLTGHRTLQNTGRSEGSGFLNSLVQLVDIFPDWAEEDLSLVLADCGGDVELVISRISEGHVSQWSQSNTTAKKLQRKHGGRGSLSNVRQHPSSRPSPRNVPSQSTRTESSKRQEEVDLGRRESASKTTPTALEPKSTEINAVVNVAVDVPAVQDSVPAPASANPETTPKNSHSKPIKRYTSIKNSKPASSSAAPQDVPTEHSVSVEADLSSSRADDTRELCASEHQVDATMNKLVSAIIGEELPPISTLEAPPVVQMPRKLSSRMPKTAFPIQPAVVLPINATVKSGISVNFGGKALTNPPLAPTSPFVEISPRYDSNSRSSESPMAGQTRYTSTSVETASIQPPRESNFTTSSPTLVASSLNPENGVARRNLPIQRPSNYGHQRETYLNAPPGLVASGTEVQQASEQSASFGKPLATQTTGPRFSGCNYHMEDANDSAPGFAQFYSQSSSHTQHQPLGSRNAYNGHMHQLNPASPYSRSVESVPKQAAVSDRIHSSAAAPGTHSHWATAFALPQASSGNYYQDTHFAQHVYQDSIPHLSSVPVNSASPYVLHHQHSQPQYSHQNSNSRYTMMPQQQMYQDNQNFYSSGGSDHNFVTSQYSMRPLSHPGTRQNFFPKGNI